MGNQQQQQQLKSMLVSNSDELFNWEFINQSDCSSVGGFSDDDVSILDVVSLSSMSSSDLDDVDVNARVDEVSDHDVRIVDEVSVHDVDVSVEQVSDHDVRAEQVSDHDADHHQEVEEEEGGDSMVMKDEPIKHVVVPVRQFAEADKCPFKYDPEYGIYDRDYGQYLDDEAEDDQDDGVDDDLVPWEMKNLYVKERIKKSGKKSLIKTVVRSKKMLGSVRGRYGVGLKAY